MLVVDGDVEEDGKVLKEFVGENKVVKEIVDAVGAELINQSGARVLSYAVGLNPCSKLGVFV